MKKAIVIGLLMVIVIVMGFVETTVALSPVTVIDDLGRTVVIKSSERIVSIGPSCTEILYALGLGDRVIAVDKYSDYPPEAIAKQKISKCYMPDPEEITALNPDLVVYYHWGPWDPTVEILSNLGLTVIALHPETIEDIVKNIRLLGAATGKVREAEVLASNFIKRLNEIKSKTSGVTVRPRVYIESWYRKKFRGGLSRSMSLHSLARGKRLTQGDLPLLRALSLFLGRWLLEPRLLLCGQA